MNQRTDIAQLIKALSANDPNQQAHAALTLGEQEVYAALPQLRKLHLDSNKLVTLAAMYACWQLGEDSIDPQLVLNAASSEDESLMALAVELVSNVGDSLVEKLAPYVLDSTADPRVVLDLLFEIGTTNARNQVENHQHPEINISHYAQQLLDEWDD